jgi:small subunit ribosomal protein S16
MVVQDKRTHPSKEKVVARLGSYNPHTKELSLDKDLAQKYIDNGAQPSPRSINLLKQSGVKLPAWVKEVSNKPRTTRNAEKLRKNQPKEEVSEEATETEEPAETSNDETESTTEEVVSEEKAEEETSTEA